MPVAALSGASIYYERRGTPGGEPLVLINGASAQLLFWHPEFLALLSEAGFDIIIFDNRDMGLSEKFGGRPRYTLTDMARDVADLIEHLGLSAAHIAGTSMGGMVAQRLAIDWPHRVRSLCIIYSAPSLAFRRRDPEVEAVLAAPKATTRNEAIAQFLAREALAGSNGYEQNMAEFAAANYDRCYCPDGVTRQSLAMRGEADRTDDLGSLTMPTAVIHGRNDRLLPFTAGIAIAEAVPGAELYLFAGLGHEIARGLWPEFVQILKRTSLRAPLLDQASR